MASLQLYLRSFPTKTSQASQRWLSRWRAQRPPPPSTLFSSDFPPARCPFAFSLSSLILHFQMGPILSVSPWWRHLWPPEPRRTFHLLDCNVYPCSVKTWWLIPSTRYRTEPKLQPRFYVSHFYISSLPSQANTHACTCPVSVLGMLCSGEVLNHYLFPSWLHSCSLPPPELVLLTSVAAHFLPRPGNPFYSRGGLILEIVAQLPAPKLLLHFCDQVPTLYPTPALA